MKDVETTSVGAGRWRVFVGDEAQDGEHNSDVEMTTRLGNLRRRVDESIEVYADRTERVIATLKEVAEPEPIPEPEPEPIPEPEPVVLESIEMSCVPEQPPAGTQFEIKSVACYSNGEEITGFPNSFYIYDTSIVDHDRAFDPRFNALAEGGVTVRNNYGGVSGYVRVNVGSAGELEEPSEPEEPAEAEDPDPVAPDSDEQRAFTAEELYWAHTSAAEKIDVEYTVQPKGQPNAAPVVLNLDDAPVGVTPLKNPDGSNHRDIAIARYSDCFVIENRWHDGSAEYSGWLKLWVDGVLIIDEEFTLNLHCATRAIRDGMAQIEPTRDWDETLIPHYAIPKTMESHSGYLTPERLALDGLGMSPYAGMGATGGRYDIGVTHGADLPYALKGELWSECRANSDHSPVWPMGLRDRETGRVVDMTKRSSISLHSNLLGRRFGNGTTNPVTRNSTSEYGPDHAHMPQFNVVSYLATGSDFDLEQIGFGAAYQIAWGNPSYRQYGKCVVTNQTSQIRGKAWQIRSVGYYARLLPTGHPDKASYMGVIENNVEYVWRRAYAPGKPLNNYLGITFDVIYPDSTGRKRGIGPWQQHHLASALSQLVRMGFENVRPWRDFVAAFAVNSVLQMGPIASFYSLNIIDPDKYQSTNKNADPSRMIATWNDVAADNLRTGHYDDRYADQVDVPALERDVGYGPGVMRGSNGVWLSFPANLQPALAAGVDAGLDGAQDAFDFFMTHSGAIDYSPANTYNIVPDNG